MKNYVLISLTLACLLATALLFLSFKPKNNAGGDVYMQVTTVESIIPGGLGRSKMLITDEKGNTTETDMENFYSLVGINFGNITSNNKQIVTKINELCGKGWELDKVTAGVQSPTDGGKQGIYLTRYLFKKKQ
ncbi:MAG: hypothetical protein NZ455_11860 [Bacteroidia bacterium]|nr:hypothetical protein [Bacteroidia bacterium]MDW8347548.1 hypothetical protein [Bacteroidia bacterium]